MRVIVNQLAALGNRTGVGHYANQLMRCLREQAGSDQIDEFPTGWLRYLGRFRGRGEGRRPHANDKRQEGRFAVPLRRQMRAIPQKAIDSARTWGRALFTRRFQALCHHGRYDLYHETNCIPVAADLPTIATVHDVSVLLHPEWHPADRVLHYERHFESGLRRCIHFFTVSEFTRRELIRAFHIAPTLITRTYNGVRPGLMPLPQEKIGPVLRRLGLPPRYLLHLGTIEPRKNSLRLLQAYCRLPTSLRDACPLLLVGQWGWGTTDVANYYHDEARHRGVIHLGYVAEKHLPTIYNGARALLYPSLYEGFGLPPVEMMACGGAVLASTAEALVETVGSRAHLIAPDDIAGWKEAMARVITDEEWWRSLRRGVQALAQAFTWERCAADTLQVYRSVWNSHPAVPTEQACNRSLKAG